MSPGQGFEFDLFPPEVEEDGLVGPQAALGVVGADPLHHARFPVHLPLVGLPVFVDKSDALLSEKALAQGGGEGHSSCLNADAGQDIARGHITSLRPRRKAPP
jgi:hypothetical protein